MQVTHVVLCMHSCGSSRQPLALSSVNAVPKHLLLLDVLRALLGDGLHALLHLILLLHSC